MKKCLSKTIDKCERALLQALPVVVFFSYYPVLKLGDDGRMNFELSIPLIWLALFGSVSLFHSGRIIKTLGRKKCILLAIFPLFATLSVLWSANRLRGLLVAGVLDLVVLAGLNILSMKCRSRTSLYLALRGLRIRSIRIPAPKRASNRAAIHGQSTNRSRPTLSVFYI